MNSTLAKISSTAAGSADLIARLIRRMCLLREQGNDAEAEKIECDQLASAIRDYRLEHGPEALPDLTLKNIFAVEKERATEAVLLAELLLPQLLEHWPTPGFNAGRTIAAETARESQSEAVTAHSNVSHGARVTAQGAGPPAIPDLLDAMLAYESASRRRGSTNLTPRRP